MEAARRFEFEAEITSTIIARLDLLRLRKQIFFSERVIFAK
jgi:hypothetical protein